MIIDKLSILAEISARLLAHILLSLILIIYNFTCYVMIKTTITKTASIILHSEHIPFRKTVSGILIAM